eukprot:TRINITY_DN122694_c0_g1_i1.p1 TRINITY_DN122694_c0_g1~~TRINITY_DN122694_c0_g1_i1.p1  ORF type:complete len:355 (+),score=66.61 TRINITY_DN122694_c0_g1_i1:122-1186(+)
MAPASSRGGSRRTTPRSGNSVRSVLQAAETLVAPPVVHNEVNHLNYYDRQRVVCTCDEKKQAAMISGHTWNIINNREDHEVYLRHARNPEHYIDVETGKNTHHWFQKKGRVDLDGNGIIDSMDSADVQEVMTCPGSSGKEDAYLRCRQARQLCQAGAPRDYGLYVQRRQQSRVPSTPGPRTDGPLERKLEFQDRLLDLHQRETPRTVARNLWTPRRGEVAADPAPPSEKAMFRKVHQLRAESHLDVTDKSLAEALSADAGGDAPGRSNLAHCSTVRTQMPMASAGLPPKPGAERTKHAAARIEPTFVREITSWPFQGKDKMKHGDPYFTKPLQNTGSSSVKYDILTGDRYQYWY